MQIILTEDLKHKGHVGDLVKVSLGYARYLFNEKLAIPKTDENLKRINSLKKIQQEKLAKEKSNYQAIAKTLNGKILQIEVKTHDEGKLYGSVSASDVIQLIKKAYDIEIDRRKVDMPDHIKEIGEFGIKLDLHPEVECIMKLNVFTTEEEPAPELTPEEQTVKKAEKADK